MMYILANDLKPIAAKKPEPVEAAKPAPVKADKPAKKPQYEIRYKKLLSEISLRLTVE